MDSRSDTIVMRQEIDGLQVRYNTGEAGDRWTPGQTFTAGLLFAFHGAGSSGLQAGSLQRFTFPETRDTWGPAEEFTISLPFALRNGSNSRNRVTSLCLL